MMIEKPTRDDLMKQPPKDERDKQPVEPMPENDPEALIKWGKKYIQGEP
jgi:hypothetical protein